MSASPDPAAELATLSSALRAHLQCLSDAGSYGLPAASAELAQERRPDAAAASEPCGSPRVEPALAAVALDQSPTSQPPAAPMPHAAPAVGQARGVRDVRPEQGARSPLDPPSGIAAAPAPQPVPELKAGRHREAAGAQLQQLAARVADCRACALCQARTQAVFARGTGAAGLCFVGEGPGEDEDRLGEPFVGKAGQLLDRMIAAMGLQRDEVYICNIVKCRPPRNRRPAPEEMAACLPYLTEQLQAVEPRVIIALGATAVEGLLGITGIMRLRGKWRLYRGEIAVMPTYHPAYLLRNPAAKRDVWNDLKEVLRYLGRPVPARR